MDFEEILQRQYVQQEFFCGPLPRGREEQRILAKAFAQYMCDEIYEYLNALSYKHFLPTEEKPRATRLLELVDVFKYFLCICWSEGLTASEFIDFFERKTEAVYEKHKKKLFSEQIIGFDIDGVLADIVQDGYDFQANEHIKEEYFETGRALTCQPCEGSRELLECLKERGWTVILITARKRWKYRRLEHETYEWLKKNHLPYDALFWGDDKVGVCEEKKISLKYFVDDHPKNAIDMAVNGIKTFLVGKRGGMEISHPNIIKVEKISDILAYLEDESGRA